MQTVKEGAGTLECDIPMSSVKSRLGGSYTSCIFLLCWCPEVFGVPLLRGGAAVGSSNSSSTTRSASRRLKAGKEKPFQPPRYRGYVRESTNISLLGTLDTRGTESLQLPRHTGGLAGLSRCGPADTLGTCSTQTLQANTCPGD